MPDLDLAQSTGVNQPYDWDDYRSDWRSSPAYVQQESELTDALSTLYPPFGSVLEVGPGFGRVTRLLLEAYPATSPYWALDVSGAALDQAEHHVADLLPGGFTAKIVNHLEDPELAPHLPKADLVLAVEVLLHIPPASVSQAISNLLSAVKPYTGVLVTCDWTQDLGKTPIRRDNYRHDYMSLFHRAGASMIESRRTGFQSIFVVRP